MLEAPGADEAALAVVSKEIGIAVKLMAGCVGTMANLEKKQVNALNRAIFRETRTIVSKDGYGR